MEAGGCRVRHFGGIDRHLKALQEACSAWLVYQSQRSASRLPALPDSLEKKGPEQPEVLGLLYQMRKYNRLPYDGAFDDQPWITMREIGAAEKAEAELLRLERVNAENRAEWAGKKANGLS